MCWATLGHSDPRQLCCVEVKLGVAAGWTSDSTSGLLHFQHQHSLHFLPPPRKVLDPEADVSVAPLKPLLPVSSQQQTHLARHNQVGVVIFFKKKNRF